ncbi:MAG: copper-binding protein [Chloracidobacterium sp.]|nr:copper-binding protein [Chloracidobacterium sp.]
MKNQIMTITLLILLSVFIMATCSKASQNKVVPTTETQTYRSVGVVKSVDFDSGKVKVDHEDIPGYMSRMEMNEPVADKKHLEGLKAGDKVEFEILREGAKITFTKFTKVGEVAILDGAEIYKTNCAECHGSIGEGAEKGIPLTSGHALNHSENEYTEQVKNGDGKKMPAFKERLSEVQISGVVKFVREEIQRGAEVKKDHRHHH